MTKELFKWSVKCSDDCKNADGPIDMVFVTDTRELPKMSCGPCEGRIIEDVTFIESYTITE